jgi:UDP-glucose 4-epimerase
MKILVTGAAGFIGSHIVSKHLKIGDCVWGIDNFFSGKNENIDPFRNNSNFRFDKQDITTWDGLKEAVQWSERIYHMAAIIGQFFVIANPIEVLTNNIRGCERILSLASEVNKQTRILIASSSSVYNDIKEGFFTEDLPLLVDSEYYCQASYPVSKIVNELFAISYMQKKQVHCTIARIFNSIGTRQSSRYGMVVPRFIEQALRGEPITVYGDGSQTRSFCNVEDTIEGLHLLLENPSCNGEIVNVGNDYEISINELAKIILKLTKSSSKIIYVPYEKAYGCLYKEKMKRNPSLEKLKNLTGFKPQISLEKTLVEIIESKRKLKGTPSL